MWKFHRAEKDDGEDATLDISMEFRMAFNSAKGVPLWGGSSLKNSRCGVAATTLDEGNGMVGQRLSGEQVG